MDFTGLQEVSIEIVMSYSFFLGIEAKSSADLQIPLDKETRKKGYEHFLSIEDKIRKGGEERFVYSVLVEKGLLFKRKKYEKRTNIVKYPGIRSMYLNEKAVTPAFVQKTREDIINRLKKSLAVYVESITPYFNMTARQTIDSKY